ncbi:hypothetical protein BC835DRAFT_1309600 [Cytidiella melzeri]|nr:hypothetical protein BC835DRAFT_1309600 [Cytidiella melzeri]
MQPIIPHPCGFKNRYVLPGCTHTQKSGKTTLVSFDSPGKPVGYGVSVLDLSVALESGKDLRKVVLNGDDLINLGAPRIFHVISWPSHPTQDVRRTIEMQTPRGPITRGDLACQVASEIYRLTTKLKSQPKDPDCMQFFLGASTPPFDLSTVMLVGLYSVGRDTVRADLELMK